MRSDEWAMGLSFVLVDGFVEQKLRSKKVQRRGGGAKRFNAEAQRTQRNAEKIKSIIPGRAMEQKRSTQRRREQRGTRRRSRDAQTNLRMIYRDAARDQHCLTQSTLRKFSRFFAFLCVLCVSALMLCLSILRVINTAEPKLIFMNSPDFLRSSALLRVSALMLCLSCLPTSHASG